MRPNKWLRKLQRTAHSPTDGPAAGRLQPPDPAQEPTSPNSSPSSAFPSLLRSPGRTFRVRSTSHVGANTKEAADTAALSQRPPDDFGPTPSAPTKDQSLSSSASHVTPLNASGTASNSPASPSARLAPSVPGAPVEAQVQSSAAPSLSSGAEEWESTEDLRNDHDLEASSDAKDSDTLMSFGRGRNNQNGQATEGAENIQDLGMRDHPTQNAFDPQTKGTDVLEGSQKSIRREDQDVAPQGTVAPAASTTAVSAFATAPSAPSLTAPQEALATKSATQLPKTPSSPSSGPIFTPSKSASSGVHTVDPTPTGYHTLGLGETKSSLSFLAPPTENLSGSHQFDPASLQDFGFSENSPQDLASSLSVPANKPRKFSTETPAQEPAAVTPKAPMVSWFSPSLTDVSRKAMSSPKSQTRPDFLKAEQAQSPPTASVPPIGQGAPQLGEIPPLATLSTTNTDDDLLASWGLIRPMDG